MDDSSVWTSLVNVAFQFWTEIRNNSITENLGLALAIAPLLLAAGGMSWFFVRRFEIAQANLEINGLSDQVKALKARVQSADAKRDAVIEEAKTLRQTLAAAHARQPEEILARAAKAESQQNYEEAIRDLQSGFEDLRKPFCGIVLKLAEHGASLVEDTPRLRAAAHYARAVALLSPGDTEAADLAVELHDTLAALGEAGSEIVNVDWSAGLESSFAVKARADLTVAKLCKKSVELLYEMRHKQALLIAARATTIARRAFGDASHFTFAARYHLAQALTYENRNAEALAEIEKYEQMQAQTEGVENPHYLSTRQLKASILLDLRNGLAALAEIDSYAPIQERVMGKENSDFFATRYLKSEVLASLDRKTEALAEIENLIPAQARVLGGNHLSTFKSRYHRAKLLNDLDRSSEAINEIEDFSPKEERLLGRGHPHVFLTKCLKILVLHDLDRYGETFEQIEEIKYESGKKLGPNSIYPFAIDVLKSVALTKLNRAAEGLELAVNTVKRLIEFGGAGHAVSLRARCAEALAREQLGQKTDALNIAAEILPGIVTEFGSNDREYRNVQAMIARLS